MLTRYINCKHIISNEYLESSQNLKRDQRSITDDLRLQKGIEHEVDYFQELKKNILKLKILNP